MNELHLKYVDDLSLAEKINMNTQIIPSPIEERPQPDPFRARTGHKLKMEDSKVFKQLLETKRYADDHKMRLNFKKK